MSRDGAKEAGLEAGYTGDRAAGQQREATGVLGGQTGQVGASDQAGKGSRCLSLAAAHQGPLSASGKGGDK